MQSDIDLMTDNQTLMSALHSSSQTKEQIHGLLKKRVKAIAFEHIKGEFGEYPIVRSMSELARITSYNVCYTKLLRRTFKIHFY